MKNSTVVGAPLQVADVSDIPVAEVSGLTVMGDGESQTLIAVGDRRGCLARASLPATGPSSRWDRWEWQVVDLADLGVRAGVSLDQFEAVCADGAGRLVMMQEEPARVLVLDPAVPELVAAAVLDAGSDELLASVWDNDANSRAESMVLLAQGRVFVVKEKRPICFALFAPNADSAELDVLGRAAAVSGPWGAFASAGAGRGPAAAPLVVRAAWRAGKGIERMGDVSDAAIGPDGALYLVSDQSATIARIDTVGEPGKALHPSHVWAIADAPAKCEGLAFGADGTCYVGRDTPEPRDNLLVIPAAAFGLPSWS